MTPPSDEGGLFCVRRGGALPLPPKFEEDGRGERPLSHRWKKAAGRRARLQKITHSQTRPCAPHKTKAHGQSRSCADNTSCFGFGNGDSPGTAHLVSDLSRRFTRGHHSDLLAGHLTPFRRQSLTRPARCPVMNLSKLSVAQPRANCKGKVRAIGSPARRASR